MIIERGIHMKLKFTHPTIPTSEVKITKAFSQHMPRLSKLKTCVDFYRKNRCFDRQIIVDGEGYLHDGYCAYLVAVLAGVAEIKVLMIEEKAVLGVSTTEPAKESELEPVKLYCTKSCGRTLTKGKVYEFDGHRVNYDGLDCFYANDFEDWKHGDSGFASCLAPLVRRPAKVGEWVYVLDRGTSRYEEKRIYKVFDTGSNSCVWFAEDCKGNIPKENYLVLDGYTGDPA